MFAVHCVCRPQEHDLFLGLFQPRCPRGACDLFTPTLGTAPLWLCAPGFKKRGDQRAQEGEDTKTESAKETLGERRKLWDAELCGGRLAFQRVGGCKADPISTSLTLTFTLNISGRMLPSPLLN